VTATRPGRDVPEILLVRVLAACGPYAQGDHLAVAYNAPDVGRIATHEPTQADVPAAPGVPIPMAVQVVVTLGAEPYAAGDVLALWFVDPRFARIARVRAATHHSGSEAGPVAAADPGPAPADSVPSPAVAQPPESALAMVRLHWGGDRVRRFVQVVDRLFTVDRLGWYRHALAMRLLVPDEIRCGDPTLDPPAGAALQALRDAAVETMGGPLLEAFMPNFSVTAEWLDTLDAPAGARSLAQLRRTIESIEAGRVCALELVPEPDCTVGGIAAGDLAATADLCLDAALPVFIPCRSIFPDVSERLAAYRRALIDLFGQTARSAKLVRLTQMAEPCHALDDRLWHLVGTIGESFGGLAPG